jgi:hypothetical protein
MNKQPKSADLHNRQAILDEINALLGADNGIDETRAKKVRKAIDALRNTDDTSVTGDDQPADNSDLDATIDTELETLRARIHKQVERRNRDYEKAHQLMDELETGLKANELQQAEHAYHKLMSIMGNIPGLSEQRWQGIEKRLNRVRPRLRKLESWRHWGTTQARKDLIDQVMQLKDSGLQPEKLAKRIKQAREQWLAWDKSGDNAGKELWKAFDQACEEAYKPCSAHFKKLKQQRAENLRQRQAIIAKLNARHASTDWKQPDWREINKFINHARRDFHKIGNVDFKHRKPLAKALGETFEKFEHYLSREREHSLRTRERLIADIEALGAVENLRDALDQLATLKKQWTITVTDKRNLENRLWQRFQAACDSIYRRRDDERKELAAERGENLKHKQALVEELAQVAATSDDELLTNASILARIQDRWQKIGWVPRKHEKSLDNRWHEARKHFSKALAAAESRAQASELDNIAKCAALCNQCEQAILAVSAIDTDGIKAEWDSLPTLSGANAEAMNQRFTLALTRPDDTKLSRNLAVKQDACLRLEVLLELESPKECQAERMAYQIDRLNASMKKDQSAQDLPEDLLLVVLSTGAVPAEVAGAIEKRIENCLARSCDLLVPYH